jgi:hypothetical protein
MLASPVTTPGDLPWLHATAASNAWLHALASPDHFSHSTAAPRKLALRLPRASTVAAATAAATSPRPRTPSDAALFGPSACDEAQPWDAPWLGSGRSDDATSDDDDAATPVRATFHHTLPRRIAQRKAADALAYKGTTSLLQLSTVDLPIEPVRAAVGSPAPRLRRTRTSEAPSRTAPSSPSSTLRRSLRRNHVRTNSAPHDAADAPPPPAAPGLHVDTALPVTLPPRTLCVPTVEPLAFPLAEWAQDEQRTGASAVASTSGGAPQLQRTLSGVSIGSMSGAESDGSWHGDAGDDDPDAQLAAANARAVLRGHRRPRPRVAAAVSAVATDAQRLAERAEEVSQDMEIAQLAGGVVEALSTLLELPLVVTGLSARLLGFAKEVVPVPSSPSPAPSRLPLPAALSRSSSIESLGSLARMPSLSHSVSSLSSSDDEDDDAFTLANEAQRAAAWRALGATPEEPSAEVKLAARRRRIALATLRRAQADSLRLTPLVQQRADSKARRGGSAPVSPLWDESEPDVTSYERSWPSLFGL